MVQSWNLTQRPRNMRFLVFMIIIVSFSGNQTANAHILTVVYYSEYDFGYYECFVAKGNSFLTNHAYPYLQ